MDNEKNTPAVTENTENDALASYLEKSESNTKDTKKAKKNSPKTALFITIAAVLVVAIVIAIVILSKPKQTTFADLKNPLPMNYTVDSDGQHQASPVLDKKGRLDTENYKPEGTLIEYIPSDIKQMDIENQTGSFTIFANTPFTTDPATGQTTRGTTVYTLKGFEKTALLSGGPDTIANDCCAINFKRVADINGKKASDFGFDKPVATVKTYFTDGTNSKVIIGSKAPNNDGTYIMFGSNKTIYLVDNTYIDGYLFSVLDLMPLDVTQAPDSIENSEFKSISISGSAFKDTIELKPNTDKAITSSCLMTAPYTMFVSEVEISNIEGAIRGLYAVEAMCLNPKKSHMDKYGLTNPYAKITAKYADATITIKSSAPKDGYVYIYADTNNLIFKMDASKLAWVTTSVEKLTPSVVLAPEFTAISKITVTDNSGTHTINLDTSTETVENTNGYTETIAYTDAYYNGKKLDEQNVRIFCQNITNMTNVGKIGNTKAGKVALTITITYSTGRSADTIKIYETEGTKYIAELNSRKLCLVNKAYCTDFSKSLQDLIAGKTVSSM